MCLSLRMKKVRNSRDLSLEKFGESLGITKDTAYNMESERQKVSGDVLALIVKEFDVSANWLLTGDGDMYDGKVVKGTIGDKRKKRVKSLVDDYFNTHSGDDLVWFEGQIKRCFIGYEC